MKTSLITCLLTTFIAGFGIYSQAQLTPHQAVALMQKGINLGNTLEPPLEGGWNNPPAQEYYFDLYQQAGFNTVRIPVRWDQHTQTVSPYTITESWLQRVEEVLDWGLERGLFVVVNAHHDDWIKQNYADPNMQARFDSIWSQIAVRFKDKPDRLLFEILNEPHGLTKEQNDEMHQRVLSIIRKTNPTRIVIFQGHNWGGSDELITAAIPDDDYLMGSFHSYDPYLFGLEGEGTWGTAADYSILRQKFIDVKTWSDNNNIPVFLGEFGSLRSCDYNSRMKHYRAYVEFAQQYGFIACAWDDGGDFRIMERAAQKWDEVKDILLHTTNQAPTNILLQPQDTLIKVTWANVLADADSVSVEYRTITGNWGKLASLPGDAANYTHLFPGYDTYHYYRVISHHTTQGNLYSQPARVFLDTYIPVSRAPFTGEPLAIPGLIEAEDFDLGGESLAYHDNTALNIGGAYRITDAVDIFLHNGKYFIGNISPGEWYGYTVEVAETGFYQLETNITAYYKGGSFAFEIGNVQTETFSVPFIGNWDKIITLTDTVFLNAGEQTLKISIIDDPEFYIDNVTFSRLAEPSTVNTSEPQTSQTNIYLNNNNDIVVKTTSTETPQRFELYDLSGRLIQCIYQPGRYFSVPLMHLSSGMYITRIGYKNHVHSTKIMLR